mmetsp:Transcript_27434/g.59988  ORF Transcript_27434/g.59988 Transcript_27434/m.59988 type:complete len:227 (+) Transcript_27434:42-722(+)
MESSAYPTEPIASAPPTEPIGQVPDTIPEPPRSSASAGYLAEPPGTETRLLAPERILRGRARVEVATPPRRVVPSPPRTVASPPRTVASPPRIVASPPRSVRVVMAPAPPKTMPAPAPRGHWVWQRMPMPVAAPVVYQAPRIPLTTVYIPVQQPRQQVLVVEKPVYIDRVVQKPVYIESYPTEVFQVIEDGSDKTFSYHDPLVGCDFVSPTLPATNENPNFQSDWW